MSTNSLHLDLPSAERPSVVPWIIALAASIFLFFLVSKQLRQIPASLQQEAERVLSSAENRSDFDDITVTANGRELQLSGSINIDRTVQPLIDQLSRITGVHSVIQNITTVDPTAQMQEAAQRFDTTLTAMDISQVAFEPGSVVFTPESDSALSQLLALLKEHPQGRVRIEGHTDNTGSDAVNLRVSRDRASAVANYLIARGIPADQLIIKGYGSTQPIADNATETGRARNRRIEVNPTN